MGHPIHAYPRPLTPVARFVLSPLLRPDSSGVAVGAVYLRQISDVDRMLEHRWTRRRYSGGALRFGHQRVALITILADDSAIATHVLPIMAAEAAIEVVMAQIVGVGLPVHFHFWKLGVLKDLLQFGDRVSNLELPGLRNVGILALVEVIDALGNALQGRIGGRVIRS